MTSAMHDAVHLAHEHSVTGVLIFALLLAAGLLVAAVGYGGAVWVARGRGRWPKHRVVCWYAGLACIAAGLTGPLGTAAHSSFTAHMAAHLLVGMLAPLLLVLSAPLSLLLRALSTSNARALSRLMSTRFVRAISHPAIAAMLNAGGLWLLYTTDLFHLMHSSPTVHAAVHAHILLAGYIFTASLVSVDPNPHRASLVVRSSVLIVFIAAHSILAKWLYAHPPAGVGASDAQAGAQLMYYGGDAVDLVLIALLFTGWYRGTRPREAASQQAREPGTAAWDRF